MNSPQKNEVVVTRSGALETREAAMAASAPTNKEAVRAVANDVVKTTPIAGPAAKQSVVDTAASEVMAHTSPDGRSPDQASKSKGQLILTAIVLVTLGIGAVMIMSFFGGAIAVIAGVVYVGAFVLAALPVWGAGLMRKQEEDEAVVAVTRAARQKRHTSWHRSGAHQ